MLELVGGVVVERCGTGEPLMLIHGTGGTRAHWDAVREQLAAERSLLLVDLPGHGESPLPPSGVPHSPIGYARVLVEMLDRLGVGRVHCAGNSVGGWTALEVAKLGRANSVVAIGPAGLWQRHNPLSARLRLSGQYRLGRLFSPVTPPLMRSGLGRSMLLRDTVAHPRLVPPEAAVDLAGSYVATKGFNAHLRETSTERFRGGRDIAVPVTIAWGEKERLIPPRARRIHELPLSARVVSLPGCGHIPMWDDPELVVSTILHGGSNAG